MEILKILEESWKELYLQDLDFFETELATGENYDEDYQSQCRQRIKEVRAWLKGETQEEDKKEEEVQKPGIMDSVTVRLSDLTQDAQNSAPSLTIQQLIYQDIETMREMESYIAAFKKYIASTPAIDDAFLDNNSTFFRPMELDAILSVRQMKEEFLEKYFSVLDHDRIARYQKFSEGFFIKHFSQLNADLVLNHGKNEWRRKEERSRQLDVFLRLKGIKD